MKQKRIAQQIDDMDAQCMLSALQQIRSISYNSEAFRCTDTVLGVIRLAEEGLSEFEKRELVKERKRKALRNRLIDLLEVASIDKTLYGITADSIIELFGTVDR